MPRLEVARLIAAGTTAPLAAVMRTAECVRTLACARWLDCPLPQQFFRKYRKFGGRENLDGMGIKRGTPSSHADFPVDPHAMHVELKAGNTKRKRRDSSETHFREGTSANSINQGPPHSADGPGDAAWAGQISEPPINSRHRKGGGWRKT